MFINMYRFLIILVFTNICLCEDCSNVLKTYSRINYLMRQFENKLFGKSVTRMPTNYKAYYPMRGISRII